MFIVSRRANGYGRHATMNDNIRELIESLRKGKYENPSDKIELLAAALTEDGGADVDLLVSLLRAPQIPLRLAALEACRSRREEPIIEELKKMAEDLETRVRQKLAEVLGSFPAKVFFETIRTLAADHEDSVRLAAVKSTAGIPSFTELQRDLLARDSDYDVRLTAIEAMDAQKNPAVAKDFLTALVNDSDGDVEYKCADLLERRLTNHAAATEKHLPTDVTLLEKAGRVLKRLGATRYPTLVEWIAARTTIQVNLEELAKYGTDLTALALQKTLPRAHAVDEHCFSILELLLHKEPRSIALLGEAGVGKSALVNELVYELAKPENGGWRVLRISPTDFMAGTKYMGEWESKLKNLVETVRRPRRVLVYVPNLSDLSAAGRYSKSDSNVATALAPYIEDGSVVLLGESSPAEYEAGLGAIPSLDRLFQKVLFKEASFEQTLRILSAVRDETRSTIDDHTLNQLLDVSAQYLCTTARPGNAVGLLRLILKVHQAGIPISFRDILDAISKSTGIPSDFLDDSIPLDPTAVRTFF